MDINSDEDRLFVHPGELISGRFRVLSAIGEGTFSNAYTCLDIKTNSRVVLKVSRSKRSYAEAAKQEITALKILNKLDQNNKHFVKYYGSFTYHSHICLIFQKLGPSLFDALQYNKFRPFQIETVQAILWQLVNAVDILHQNRMIHTDLKLENILLKYGLIDTNGIDYVRKVFSPDIRLIDFGSLDSGSSWHRHLATTRHYRAPEILMGLKWGYECDVWSMGCILVELAVGHIDFDSRDPIEHLYLIQQMIGEIPYWMWQDCTLKGIKEIADNGHIHSDVFDLETRRYFRQKPTLAKILNFNVDLCDLALWMLNPNPEKRPTTDQILRHPFLTSYYYY